MGTNPKSETMNSNWKVGLMTTQKLFTFALALGLFAAPLLAQDPPKADEPKQDPPKKGLLEWARKHGVGGQDTPSTPPSTTGTGQGQPVVLPEVRQGQENV